MLTCVIIFKLPFPGELTEGLRRVNLIPFMDPATISSAAGAGGVLGVLRAVRLALTWDIAFNVLIFVPLGVFLYMLNCRLKILLIIAITIAFEAAQFYFMIGVADINDIIANTLGGVIGMCIYALLYLILGEGADIVMNVFAIVSVICMILFFAYILTQPRIDLVQLQRALRAAARSVPFPSP